MEGIVIISILCLTIGFDTISAESDTISTESRPQLWNDVLTMNREIQLGQSKDAGTDRDLHQWWDEFRQQKALFESLFDEKICPAPEELALILGEMVTLHDKIEIAWDLKQEQLSEIKDILYHINYVDTGLAHNKKPTGDELVDGSCEDMADYVEHANKTAWEEKEELNEQKEDLEDMDFRMDTHPCPCVWDEWGEWTTCTTTCEAGSTIRERPILKAAINDGLECQGDSLEEAVCNEDVCCPIDCVWGEWADWQSCPSGCEPQVKLRTRTVLVEAFCNGNECEGHDFEEMTCSREAELAAKVADLEHSLDECYEESHFVSSDLYDDDV